MRDPEQLALLAAIGDAVTDPYFEAVWARLLALLNDVVAVRGVKRVAGDLDTSPSVLKHALAQRDRHYVRAEWLPYLIHYAPGDELVEVIAAIRGLEVSPKKALTAEEKLERLERQISESLGPELRKSIFDRAYRR